MKLRFPRRSVVVWLVVAALVAGVFLLSRHHRESVRAAQFRPLTEALDRGDYLNATFVLSAMGTGAVAALVSELSRGNSALNQRWQHLYGGLPIRLARWLPKPQNRDERREWCAWRLGLSGPKAKSAVPALTRVLANDHETARLRSGVAWALGKIGTATEASLPTLVLALEDHDWWLRHSAAEALAHIGRPDPQALAGLARRFGDDNEAEQVRLAAAVALWRLQPADVGPSDASAEQFLVETLTRGAPQAKQHAIFLLESFGPAAAPFAAALERASLGPDLQVRAPAAAALEKVRVEDPLRPRGLLAHP